MATILCIEDEADLREDIMEELADAGYDVLEAEDGKQGLEMILKYQPDMVVSDIMMPHMNGHELLALMREKHTDFAEMPFVFLSALADTEDILCGVRLGADDYLTKPIDLELLLAKIEAGLRQIERFRLK